MPVVTIQHMKVNMVAAWHRMTCQLEKRKIISMSGDINTFCVLV